MMKKETIMIENPFEFGRAVEDEYFTDRIDDAKHWKALQMCKASRRR